jgi:hypothetical protein
VADGAFSFMPGANPTTYKFTTITLAFWILKRTWHCKSGLPDGIFSNQKSQFG